MEKMFERRITKNHVCWIFALILFLALPAICIPYQERLILSMHTGKCSLDVEADDEARILRLRVIPEYADCHITEDAMQMILRTVFSKTDQPKLEGNYTSLFLGRLIYYPWLSEYLAVSTYKDPRWDKNKGKPVFMDINKYVSAILSSKEVTTQFEEVFGDSGYRIRAVSVEKVLVGRFRDVPLYQGRMSPGKVPFDAMVWLRLEKK
jgi:hypothetical protein